MLVILINIPYYDGAYYLGNINFYCVEKGESLLVKYGESLRGDRLMCE